MHVDFEAYSDLDLRKVGVHRYAMHPSTDILCMSYGKDPDSITTWVPGQPIPNLAGRKHAFNAQFEFNIWQHVAQRRYAFPSTQISDWDCTAAQAAFNSFSGRLDYCTDFMGLDTQKLNNRVMMKLSKPDKHGKRPVPTSEEMEELIVYCEQDVVAEMTLSRSMAPLDPQEREYWLLDQKINHVGLPMDTDLAVRAIDMWDKYVETNNKRFREITGVDFSQLEAFKGWLHNEYPAFSRWGTLGKHDLFLLLQKKDLPEHCREALQIRRRLSASSVAKFKKILDATHPETNRMYGTLRFYGASRTGRWAGNLIQPQNLPRGTLKPEHVANAREIVRQGADRVAGFMYGSVKNVLQSIIRSSIAAPKGYKLISCDFASIEARGLAWAAHCLSMLNDFRKSDSNPKADDVYQTMARLIYDLDDQVPVSKDQRQLGKMTILGCGYGMGWRRFQGQAEEQWRLKLSDDMAQKCVYGYRRLYPIIPEFWNKLERKFREAMKSDPKVRQQFRFGKFKFFRPFHDPTNWVYIELPSGRCLKYRRPVTMPDNSIRFLGTCPNSKKPVYQNTYGGKLAENLIQAMCRDLLAYAMNTLDKAGYKIITTIHDEIVLEVPDANTDQILKDVSKLMSKKPDWAAMMPIKAEGWVGDFYRKD